MVAPRQHLLQQDQMRQRQCLARVFKKRFPDLLLDSDDLEQEMALRLLQAERTFQPTRGEWPGYAYQATRALLATIAKQHQLMRLLGQRTTLEDYLQLDSEFVDPLILAIDVEACLNKINPELAHLARRLMLVTVSELARELRVPQTSLQRRLQKLKLALKPEG